MSFKIIPIAFLFLISCCHPNDKLVYDCNGSCYSGPQSTRNIGECRDGVSECDDGGNLIKCVGEILPQPEDFCTGKDLACTGQIDSEVPSVQCYNGPDASEYVGACKPGNTTCINGKSVCQGEITPQIPTNCSNPELSCGIIDFGDGQYCYTGASGTAGIGPCHPGEWQCQNGTQVCSGEVTPAQNPICGQDVQCTGQPYYNTISPMDIVFIFDRSNNTAEDCMCSYFPTTTQTALDVANLIKSKNSNTEFGIVNMPDDSDTITYSSRTAQVSYFNSSILTDLTTPDTFESYVNGEHTVTYNMQAPYEGTYQVDIMDEVVSGKYNFSWRTGIPHFIVMFSNDEPDNFSVNGTLQLSSDCQTYNMMCVLFVNNSNGGYSTSNQSNYKVFGLIGNDQYMANELEQLFKKGCN